jgi:hypothetical protein
MMKQSSLLKLRKIEVISFAYGIKKKRGLNKETLMSAEEMDFEFTPQVNKKDDDIRRLIFSLKTNDTSPFVHFEVTVVMEYSFLVSKPTEEKMDSIVGILIPQLISFLRGYLVASTTNSPSTVILPFIDVVESIKRTS